MSGNIQKAKEILLQNEYTLALTDGERIVTSCKRGVKPLLEILETGEDYSGFSAADKVVGTAAAYLYVLLKIRELYAGVISDGAAAVLKKYGISYECESTVSFIINRRGDRLCPMEQATRDAADPRDALAKIKLRLAQLEAGEQ